MGFLLLSLLHFNKLTESRGSILEIRRLAAETRDIACETRHELNSYLKQDEFRNRLKAPDPVTNHEAACEKSVPGTGRQLLEHKSYLNWKLGSTNLLWLHGIAGSGKTVLCSTAIKDVMDILTHDEKRGLAYFYFDFNDPDKRSTENMVRSLVAQISVQGECVQLGTNEKNHKSSKDNLLDLLSGAISQFEDTFIIIDALDECEDMSTLWNIIRQLDSNQSVPARFLLTSRRTIQIESEFETISEAEKICIQNSLVDNDIRIYVEYRLQNDRKLSRWKSQPEIQQEIIETIANQANGMFRWAECQVDSLHTCLNITMLRNTLSSLPKTLNDTYHQALCQIPEEHVGFAAKFLQWILYSVRPLYIDELAEVVMVDIASETPLDPNRRFLDPRDVLTTLPDLLVTTNDMYQARLTHFSVKEYLTSDNCKWNPLVATRSQANTTIAEDCLLYLLQFNRPYLEVADTVISSPLLRYASNYWPAHIKAAGQDSRLMAKVMELFNTETVFLNWASFLDGYRPFEEDEVDEGFAVPSPLYYASSFGLLLAAKSLVDGGADIDEVCGPVGSALAAACVGGYTEIVKFLLQKGANPEIQGELGTPMRMATDKGYTEIVKLLLGAGANC